MAQLKSVTIERKGGRRRHGEGLKSGGDGDAGGTTVSKTRVCIKNLPPKVSEHDLKEFLLEGAKKDCKNKLSLQITDCKILKNAKGKSRKVAFVGFRLPEQAEYCVKMFHRTFLNMTRITVEHAIAKTVAGHEKIENESNNNDTTEKENIHQPSKDSKDQKRNQNVEEFLDLMGAFTGKKSKSWSNDMTQEEIETTNGTTAATTPNVDLQEKDDDDDSSSSSSSSSSDSSSSSSSDSSDDEEDGKGDTSAKKNNATANVSDLDFLRSKQKKVEDLEEEPVQEDDKGAKDDNDKSTISSSSSSWSSSSDDDENNDANMKNDSDDKEIVNEISHDEKNEQNDRTESANEHPDDDDEEETSSSQISENRLFVRNLSYETTEEELKEYFSSYGLIVECHIPVDDQKHNKGYAFVTFESAADAYQARIELDKVDFQGRLLHILKARPPPSSLTVDEHTDLSWKEKQELARKEKETKNATAGKASQGWSASFVRGDAVVDNLAERLGLRKGDLLGVKDGLSSGDAAVRLALGETQIIEENRQYFREHGVDMDVLVSANINETEETIKRSKTAILVKNLPFYTKVEELMKLFHIGDETVKILLPPSRTIAMVEYGHSTDAKKAFRNLAYRRFKHVPLYLEWAPLEAKKNTEEPEAQIKEIQMKPGDDQSNNTSQTDVIGSAEVEDDAVTEEVSATLYVKNLNFQTSEESLQEIFEKHVGTVLSVRIPRKLAPIKNGTDSESRSLSLGYGFVELSSQEQAKKALKMLQGKLLEGHALELDISSNKSSPRSVKPSVPTSGKKLPTKLMVRNVPFQATRQEILKLFGTFGQLRKVRLPKKFDGNHRGFAFVEFLTGKEALAAMTALSRTHLYGRHLVLEWASDDDENMDRLRDKAKRDAMGVTAPPKNKKIRFE